MSQAYSNPKRADDPYALPDVEVFYLGENDSARFEHFTTLAPAEYTGAEEPLDIGWYYWFCSPGCLPDSDPIGPFDSEAEALADAQEGCNDDEDDE